MKKCKMSAIIETKLELLQANYWEHFKYAKELAMYLDINHPKRVKIEKATNNMIEEINELKAQCKR